MLTKEFTKMLLDDPVSLLDTKIDVIIDLCKKHQVTNLLEIGSFAGGSAYKIAKALSNVKITSIDINEFDGYFNDPGNVHILEMLYERYKPNIIYPDTMLEIQDLYNKSISNLKIKQCELYHLDITPFDLIIVDGDHRDYIVEQELEFIFNNKNECIIIIDDIGYPPFSIKKSVENFCSKYNLEVNYTYPRYESSTNQTENDIAIIVYSNV